MPTPLSPQAPVGSGLLPAPRHSVPASQPVGVHPAALTRSPAHRLQRSASACQISAFPSSGSKALHNLGTSFHSFHSASSLAEPVQAPVCTNTQAEDRGTACSPDFLPVSHPWALRQVLLSARDALPPSPPTHFFSSDIDDNNSTKTTECPGSGHGLWLILVNSRLPWAHECGSVCLSFPT